MMYIYGLHEKDGPIRYIGQTYDPGKRMCEHWLGRADSLYHPLSMWLRTLPERPEMRILEILPDAWPKCPEVNAVEIAYILAAREEQPGQMLNILPYPPRDAPEWGVWDEMARLDDPDFVSSEEVMSPGEHLRNHWADPEWRAKHSARLKALWDDPEFRAKKTAATKAMWDNPEYRANQSTKVQQPPKLCGMILNSGL